MKKKSFTILFISVLIYSISFLPHTVNATTNSRTQFEFRKKIVNNALKNKGVSTYKIARWDSTGAADSSHSCATFVSKILQNSGILRQVCPVVKNLYYNFIGTTALTSGYKAIEIVSPNTPIDDPIGHWLEQGDIILFNGGGSLNNGFPHTGIYLGNINSAGRKIIDTSAISKTVDIRAFPHRGPKSYTAIRIYPKSYTKTPAILKYKNSKKNSSLQGDISENKLASVENICQDYLEENSGSPCPLGDESKLNITEDESSEVNDSGIILLALSAVTLAGGAVFLIKNRNQKTKKKK